MSGFEYFGVPHVLFNIKKNEFVANELTVFDLLSPKSLLLVRSLVLDARLVTTIKCLPTQMPTKLREEFRVEFVLCGSKRICSSLDSDEIKKIEIGFLPQCHVYVYRKKLFLK